MVIRNEIASRMRIKLIEDLMEVTKPGTQTKSEGARSLSPVRCYTVPKTIKHSNIMYRYYINIYYTYISFTLIIDLPDSENHRKPIRSQSDVNVEAVLPVSFSTIRMLSSKQITWQAGQKRFNSKAWNSSWRPIQIREIH